MLHLVQFDNVEEAQHYKKRAEELEDKVKEDEEHLKKLESEKKKREQYEGELGVVLWNSVNTMQADLDTHTRLVQCLSPCMSIIQCVYCGAMVCGDTSESV